MLSAAPPKLKTRRPSRWSIAALLGLLLGCQTDGQRTVAEPVGAVNSSELPTAGAPEVSSAALAGAAPAEFVGLTRPKEPLNLILLTVEALRADMPWSGYVRPMAPRLTQLAAESTLWERHRSVSSHTPQALAVLLGSRYPSGLYRDGALFTAFASANTFFPELLQGKGIRTLGVQASSAFARGQGFDQGFDVWEVLSGADGTPASAPSTSQQTLSRLMELLGQAQNTGRQFFAWVHLLDPAEPYLAPADVPEFGKQARDRYDAEVFFVDHWIGKLLDHCRTQPWWAKTALIVTGDHGEAFGEHGMSSQGQGLWDVLLQTPLLIHAPGARPKRIAAARTHLDLAPTILELMGMARDPQLLGQSLVGELYGAAAPARPVLLFELAEDVENPGLRALIAGDDKLVVAAAGGPERLFDLRADPREQEDLAEQRSGRLRELAVSFEREWARMPSVEPHGGMKLRSGRLAQGPVQPPR